MAPQIPGFFKIVLHRNIVSSILKLPSKFIKEYSGELTGIVQLVVSDGRIWEVGLTKKGNHICFSNGFQEFARHYSLRHGHLLVFEFKGNSCFTVAIYDSTSCQIAYQSRNATTGKEANKVGAGASSCAANQRRRRFMSPHQKSDCEYISRCGIPSPSHFRSNKPYFEVMLRRSHLGRNLVYVPTRAAKLMGKAQLEKRCIWLETDENSLWKVSLSDATDGRFYLRRM